MSSLKTHFGSTLYNMYNADESSKNDVKKLKPIMELVCQASLTIDDIWDQRM